MQEWLNASERWYMLSNLSINNIQFNNQYIIPKKSNISSLAQSPAKSENSEVLMNHLKYAGMISFAGLNRPVEKVSTSLLKSLEGFISKDIPVNSSEYGFLKRNPLGYYLECGKEVNKFLRSGKFDNIPVISDDIPEVLKPILQRQCEEKKEFNRIILESIPILDSRFSSKTSEPMVVFRDAPKSWIDTVKGGILHDNAYISTSTEKGASMEGIISNGADNFTYEIRLPKGTPFWDLTHTPEKEMVLPRNSNFKIVGNGVLELIL